MLEAIVMLCNHRCQLKKPAPVSRGVRGTFPMHVFRPRFSNSAGAYAKDCSFFQEGCVCFLVQVYPPSDHPLDRIDVLHRARPMTK